MDISMLTQVTPVLVELIKTGKAIGVAYFAVLGLVPILLAFIKYGFIYLILKLLATGVQATINFLFSEEKNEKSKENTKNKK